MGLLWVSRKMSLPHYFRARPVNLVTVAYWITRWLTAFPQDTLEQSCDVSHPHPRTLRRCAVWWLTWTPLSLVPAVWVWKGVLVMVMRVCNGKGKPI